jgi:hypothetical protein
MKAKERCRVAMRRGIPDRLPVDGYALLFLLALMFLAFGWWCYGRVKPDDVHTTRTVLARMVNGMWGWRPW